MAAKSDDLEKLSAMSLRDSEDEEGEEEEESAGKEVCPTSVALHTLHTDSGGRHQPKHQL